MAKLNKWWAQLLVRAGFENLLEGHDLPADTPRDKNDKITPFSFDDDQWQNIDQLKAVVEFYLNCNDPWKRREIEGGTDEVGANTPRLPDDTGFIDANAMNQGLHFVQIDCFGARNNTYGKGISKGKVSSVSGNQIKIALTNEEKGKYHKRKPPYRIWFPSDTKRASGTYEIWETKPVESDPNTLLLFLDGYPEMVSGQVCEIYESSAWLRGKQASIMGMQVKLHAKGLPRFRDAWIYFLGQPNPEIGYRFEVINEKESTIMIYKLPENMAKSGKQLGKWKIMENLSELFAGGLVGSKKNPIVLMDAYSRPLTKNVLGKINNFEKHKIAGRIRLYSRKDEKEQDKYIYKIKKVIPDQSAVIIDSRSDSLSHLQGEIYWDIPIKLSPLDGDKAIVEGAVIKLDRTSTVFANDKFNIGIDTINFPLDKRQGRHTYRITYVNSKNQTITVKGTPQLSQNSPWHIPAGIGGMVSPLKYFTKPALNSKKIRPTHIITGDGYDHYDGLLFVVSGGSIAGRFRFTSYTSHLYWESIRGNKVYNFSANTSGETDAGGNDVINYAFALRLEDTKGSGDKARYYWLAPKHNVTNSEQIGEGADAHGMSAIFVHYGYDKKEDGRSGSNGCQVSPQFFELRRFIIEDIFRSDDNDLKKIAARNIIGFGDKSLRGSWNKSSKDINGKYWLIRPDELPLGYPDIDGCVIKYQNGDYQHENHHQS